MKLIVYKKKTFLNKVDALNTIGTPCIRKDILKEILSETLSSNPLRKSDNQKVDLPHPEVQVTANDQNQIEVVHDVHEIPPIFSAEEEKIFEQKEAEKNKAQIVAAERSMSTNLVVGGWFCLFLVIQIVIVPKSLREHVGLIVCSAMRGVLPIFTTIANFGTVRFVVSQYWNAVKKVLHKS